MATSEWHCLAGGQSDEVVLAVDFESGRAGPGLADLGPLLSVPYRVLLPTPPPAGDYLDAWAGVIRDEALVVRAVVGYCAGGALALGLAARLGADPTHGGAAPAVVLLDPDTVSGDMVYYQFALALEQFSTYADPGEFAAVRERAQACCREPELTRVAAVLPAEYQRIGRQVLAEMGLDAEVAEELTGRFGEYLDYLLAAWSVGYGSASDGVLTLLSAEQALPAELRGPVRRFDIPHAELTSRPEVAELVSAVLLRGSVPAVVE